MLTLVFLSFHSEHHIRRLVKSIDSKYPIIIIENSANKKLKNELENLYDNVTVEICEENLGFSKGMNLGIKLSRTPFVFINPADISISNDALDSLIEVIQNFKSFGMLSPAYKDRSIHSNYQIWKNNKKDEDILISNRKIKLKEVDFIDGTIILNKKIINDIVFDEKIFIYFETMDLCKRLSDNKIKMYATDEITFEHFGGQSHDKKYDHQANLSRNWHYNWSKFYYYNKHNNFFYALKKVIPNLKKSLFGLLKNYFKDEIKKELHLAELSGLISSILKKKSSYRPYKKNEF